MFMTDVLCTVCGAQVYLQKFEWSDFCYGELYGFENFHFVVICTQMSSQTLFFCTILSIWK